jgi:hypothetical protein
MKFHLLETVVWLAAALFLLAFLAAVAYAVVEQMF